MASKITQTQQAFIDILAVETQLDVRSQSDTHRLPTALDMREWAAKLSNARQVLSGALASAKRCLEDGS